MTYNEIYKILQAKITEKRFTHIQGVIKAASSLAKQYGINEEDAKLAALLHDCCKEYKVKDLIKYLKDDNHPTYSTKEFLEYKPLLHGPAGAIISQKEYGITDEDILEAVRVHTVGKVNMSILDKIIFVADYIEENRDFPGVEAIRCAAKENLDYAVLLGYDSTISFLLLQQKPIFTGTIIGRNDILHKIQKHN